jgi:hypothetical protein
MGPVKYLRRTFDCINDYPPPQNGETITEWIDRLHGMNISVNSAELLEWFWPHAVLDSTYEGIETLESMPKAVDHFRWGMTVFVSNEDDLMIMKLSYPGFSRMYKPHRLKDEQ